MKCRISGCERNSQRSQFVCVYHATMGPSPETTLAERAKRAPRGSIDAALLVRMPSDLRAKLDTAAQKEGLSAAEWVRQAIQAVL